MNLTWLLSILYTNMAWIQKNKIHIEKKILYTTIKIDIWKDKNNTQLEHCK